MQIKAQFFDPGDPASIIGFLATFKLAWDTNVIHKEAATWILPHHVGERLANECNSRMCAMNKSSFITVSVCSVDNQSRELLQSYPKVVNFLLMKFSNDQAIAEFVDAVLRHMQPANMTSAVHRQFICRIVQASRRIR